MNRYKLSKYDVESTGYLVSVTEEITIRQTQTGNQPNIDHFNAKFTYEVNGQVIEGTDVLSGSIQNSKKIKEILSSEDRIIVVRYKSNDPTKSVIDLTQ